MMSRYDVCDNCDTILKEWKPERVTVEKISIRIGHRSKVHRTLESHFCHVECFTQWLFKRLQEEASPEDIEVSNGSKTRKANKKDNPG
jgi:hypothetical protein